MKLRYHEKVFALLDTLPMISQRNLDLISEFERNRQVSVPGAIREWYSIDGHQEVLQNLISPTLAHSVLNLEEGFNWGRELQNLPLGKEYFYLLEENQCVFHLAVKIDDVDDPPVYFRYYEPGENWQLHSYTFSDWVYAVAWDYLCWDNSVQVKNEAELQEILSTATVSGPETFHMNMWWKASRFYRVVHFGRRKIVLVQ